MKLSAKVLYAVKAITELALRYGDESPARIGSVSKAQNIPKKFLVQILIRLKNAGLVRSIRGVSGGYVLAKNPADLSLASVMRAVDDNIIGRRDDGVKGRGKTDIFINRIWNGVEDEIAARLEKATFDRIVYELKNEELTYHI